MKHIRGDIEMGWKELNYNKLAGILIVVIVIVVCVASYSSYVGDHPSVDTYETMAAVSVADMDDCIANGTVFLEYESFLDSLNSDIDYFQGVTPPAGYENINNDLLSEAQNLKMFIQLRQDGINKGDSSEIAQANIYYNQALQARAKANSEMQNV